MSRRVVIGPGSRPISQHQRDDLVLLAHIKEQHRLSLGSYGRPRMTEELKEMGLTSVIVVLGV